MVVDHEYLRNVLLQASASAQYAQYLPAGGYASSFSLGVGATWLIIALTVLGRFARMLRGFSDLEPSRRWPSASMAQWSRR